MAIDSLEKPVRVGVFGKPAEARAAINRLLHAGFQRPEISVICSNQGVEDLFPEFKHPPLPTEHLAEATVTGAAVGALVAGLSAAAILTSAGSAAVVIGPFLMAGAGTVAGGLVGAMSTRGVTLEMANFYDQSVTAGRILVAVEDDDPDAEQRLNRAAAIFQESGAVPVPLPEG